ncbi:DUF397 domain-containing protein [Actinomadura craniellae]|uniref:DUF397 domain-containing protein n=1 Tax=Actinomadura craniellae TaxID=2231787 RepID=A0A365H9Q3_9ACTN|nr:DUF397 domain-containing protein [Actinomadura craniellae]RAY15870.1 DUF397 domain-containing protein [Actinomadura craniellae]
MSTPQWRKSTHSGTGGLGGQECIEIADLDGGIGLRDSKNPDAGHLTLSSDSFATLLSRLKSDRPAL